MQNDIDIKFSVNNLDIEDNVDGRLTLLNYLRLGLGLTGTKNGPCCQKCASG